MDFIAIDFETANEQKESACQIGLAVVENNIITSVSSWLIRPPESRFNPYNTKVHGITYDMVKYERTFDSVWNDDVQQIIGDNIIVAHNAGFDIRILKSCLSFYDLDYEANQYFCSLLLAKNTWPGLDSYSLRNLSETFDFEIPPGRHDAAIDAELCALLTIKALTEKGIDTLDDLNSIHGIVPGCLTDDDYTCYDSNGYQKTKRAVTAKSKTSQKKTYTYQPALLTPKKMGGMSWGAGCMTVIILLILAVICNNYNNNHPEYTAAKPSPAPSNKTTTEKPTTIPPKQSKPQAETKPQPTAQDIHAMDVYMQRMINEGLVLKIDAENHEIFIATNVWALYNIEIKENIARHFAVYCSYHSTLKAEWVIIIDYMSGKKIAKQGAFGLKIY